MDKPFAKDHGQIVKAWSTCASVLSTSDHFSTVGGCKWESVKKRFHELIDEQQKYDSESKKASGVEEDFSERTSLMAEAVDLMKTLKETKIETAGEKQNLEKLNQQGIQIRHAAMIGLNKRNLDDGQETQQTQKNKKTPIVQAIDIAKERAQLEQARIDLETKRLDLEERKLLADQDRLKSEQERWKSEQELKIKELALQSEERRAAIEERKQLQTLLLSLVQFPNDK